MDNSLDTKPVLVVDWSVVTYKTWHRMASDNYKSETGSEERDFAINAYLYMYYLMERFEPYELYIIVDDKKPWRGRYMLDYYRQHAEVYASREKDEEIDEVNPLASKSYILAFENKVIRHTLLDETDDWYRKKLTAAEKEKIDWENFIPVHDQEIKEKIFWMVNETDVMYKGSRRNQQWNYETPKNGYTNENGEYIPGFKDIVEGMAITMAKAFKGKAIKVKGAEADDVIARLAIRHKGPRDFVLVSVDSDLHQLAIHNPFFSYYNPNYTSDGKRDQFGDLIPLKASVAKFKLRQKILAGDSSDNIHGCQHIDPKKLFGKKHERILKSTLIAEKTAIEYLTTYSSKELIEIIIEKSFKRNRKLIDLTKLPKELVKKIDEAIDKAKTRKKGDVTYKTFGVSNKFRLITREIARMRGMGEKVNWEDLNKEDTE